MKLRTQIFAILSVTVLAGMGTLGYTLNKALGVFFLEQFRTTITGYAQAASFLVDGDVHAGFTNPDSAESSAYVQMRDRLRAFMAVDARIGGIYTMARTDDPNVLSFVVNASPVVDRDGDGIVSKAEAPLVFGTQYDMSRFPELQKAFQVAGADKTIDRDRWGWWLSAYAPIRNSRQEVVGIVGLDVSAETIRNDMAVVRNMILCFFGAFVLLALLFSSLYASTLTRPIGKMVSVCMEIGRGNYQQRIGLKKRNEIGVLASTLDSMAENIRRSFDKMSTLHRTANILTSTLDLNQALKISLNLAMQVTRSVRGAIFLVEGEAERIRLAAGEGIEGLRGEGDLCFVGDLPVPMRLDREHAVLEKQWLELTGCTRCFFLEAKESLRGVFLLDPQIQDEEFLTTLMAQISIGIDNARLFHEAVTDSATGLFIKRYFQIRLDAETRKLNKSKKGISLLMLDIDRFKQINDTFGHPFGDLVLIEVGRIISESVRDVDFVARFGGDEFVVILPESTAENAQAIAERILGRVGNARFRSADREIGITVSIGICHSIGDRSVSPEGLLGIADSALYKAKEAGRNTFWILPAHS